MPSAGERTDKTWHIHPANTTLRCNEQSRCPVRRNRKSMLVKEARLRSYVSLAAKISGDPGLGKRKRDDRTAAQRKFLKVTEMLSIFIVVVVIQLTHLLKLTDCTRPRLNYGKAVDLG